MRIPSIIKLPRHQRFHVEPRYYDPVKEEIEQRTSRIKKELELEKKGKTTVNEEELCKTRIEGAFSGRIAKRERSGSTGVFQFLLVIVLFLGFIGYLYYGNTALYLVGLFMMLFIYLKFRKIL